MLLDQYSLLAAIVFSSAALCLTLLLSWASVRGDRFLLTWSAGMASIVGGVILFGLLDERYDPALQCASFVFLIVGFTLVYAGGAEFRTGRANWKKVTALGLLLTLPVMFCFASGYSGLATILSNVAIALLLVLSGLHYWTGRRESPLPMTANSILYWISAASFLLCCVPLLIDGQMVLTARPSNWAEDINMIVSIIGLTGIGAVSLALNQTRISRRHQWAAMTDPLTGLLNRRALFERVGGAEVAVGTATIVLDLDHFKSINDRFGHACGDAVIAHFAAIIRRHIAPSDLASRMGGEEFCIVLPDTCARSPSRMAEDIRGALDAHPVDTPAGPINATVSIGVAICTGHPQSFDALLDRADRALYAAKRDGRNRVHNSRLRIVAA